MKDENSTLIYFYPLKKDNYTCFAFFKIISYHNVEEINGCFAQQCTPRYIGLLGLWKAFKSSFRVGHIGICDIKEVMVTG